MSNSILERSCPLCREEGLRFVVDGTIRDWLGIKELGFPAFREGSQAAVWDGPGEINVPISCGGVVVNP